MKKICLALVAMFLGLTCVSSVVHAGRFQWVLEDSLSGGEWELPGGNTLLDYQETSLVSEVWWAEGIRDLLITIAVTILIPVFVFAGIIIAILWFYKLMTSEAEDETSKAWNYIIYGVIWVMIMISAWYITNLLVGADGSGSASSVFDFEGRSELDGPALAAQIYEMIAYPLLKIFLNLAMGILFIIVMVNAFKMIFSPDDNIVSKAWSILVYSIIWVLAILLSKNIVELVYGNYEQVIVKLNPGEEWELGEVWLLFGGLGGDWWVTIRASALERIRWVINRVLWLATFIVTVIIIYLGYMMLIKPNDEDSTKKIKSYLIYMIIGIFIIGFSYLLSRMLIVTW